jgi:hypothetical protein
VQPLPNRGGVRLASGDRPALATLAIGRHIHRWSKTGWRRIAGADSPVTALWVQSSSRMYVATRRGTLARVERGRQLPIRHPLAADDPVITLVGRAPAGAVYGIAQSGAVLAVGTKRARLVQSGEALSGFVPQGAAVDAGGALWLAGVVSETPSPASETGGPPSEPASPGPVVLARAQGNVLDLVEVIPGVGADDPVTMLLFGADGTLLVATGKGLLQYRPLRESWKSATIKSSLPAGAWDGARVGPAQAR